MNSPAFALISLLLPSFALSETKVNVTVYYESLCPDSQKFFNKQLIETFKTPLAAFMNLTLVPFGNANVTGGVITCQHGPVECYGNRIQACAISKEPNPENNVRFINCLMQKAFDKKPTDNDAYKAFVTECGHWVDNRTGPIESCAANPQESDSLMFHYANMTKSANPPIKGVPTVFFDGKSSKDINDAATKDFTDELCKYISGPSKPHECSTKNNAKDLLSSATIIAAALIIARFH